MLTFGRQLRGILCIKLPFNLHMYFNFNQYIYEKV
jgi:hypothetical protein